MAGEEYVAVYQRRGAVAAMIRVRFGAPHPARAATTNARTAKTLRPMLTGRNGAHDPIPPSRLIDGLFLDF